jgi:putative FmdB family regulatory protein
MPAYDYRCNKCGEITELVCSISELLDKEKILKCEKCGNSILSRKIAPFVTHFTYTRGNK